MERSKLPMKKACILLSAALLLLFLFPLFFAGILNLGNLTGILVTGALIVFLTKTEKIKEFIKNIYKKKVPAVLFSAFSFAAAAFSLFLAFSLAVVISGTGKTDEKELTLIVLGCQVKGESPSLMLSERLSAAYGYLSENPDSVCIVSGGQGADEEMSEALCMYNYLTGHGIEKERIFLEDKSTSTYENLKFSKAVMEKAGLTGKVGIVTNEFHEKRANMIAGRLGIESTGVPAPTLWVLKPTYYLREAYALIYDYLRR